MLPSLRDEYSYPQIERRRSVRYEFSTEIEIEWCGKKYWGRVRNISRHGMFIALPDLPVLNAAFSANLALNLPLKVECVVTRVARARYEALLMALAIDSNAFKMKTRRVQVLIPTVFQCGCHTNFCGAIQRRISA